MPAFRSFRKMLPSLPSLAIAVAALALAGVIAEAQELKPSTDARISHACGMLLGLDKSEAPYADCVRSLSSSAEANAASMVSPPPMMIASACGDVGFVQGTPAFDQCTANLRGALNSLSLNAR